MNNTSIQDQEWSQNVKGINLFWLVGFRVTGQESDFDVIGKLSNLLRYICFSNFQTKHYRFLICLKVSKSSFVHTFFFEGGTEYFWEGKIENYTNMTVVWKWF